MLESAGVSGTGRLYWKESEQELYKQSRGRGNGGVGRLDRAGEGVSTPRVLPEEHRLS